MRTKVFQMTSHFDLQGKMAWAAILARFSCRAIRTVPLQRVVHLCFRFAAAKFTCVKIIAVFLVVVPHVVLVTIDWFSLCASFVLVPSVFLAFVVCA